MRKKIFIISIFVTAGLSCLLALIFALRFDDNKTDLFHEIDYINKVNSNVISDFKVITVATIPHFITKYNEEKAKLNNDLKEKQLQKDIYYTFITELKNINDANAFAEYKSKFDVRSNLLLAKANNKDKLINDFNKVKAFSELSNYINSIDADYNIVKQDYLTDKNYIRSLSNFIKRVFDINAVVSESKKNADLKTLQSNVSASNSEERILNIAIVLFYVIFAISMLIIFIFSIWEIIANIKTSYKVMLAVLFLILVSITGYIIASPELSKSAIIMGNTEFQVKWVESGIFTLYIVLAGAILSIFVLPVISKFKKI